MTKVCWECFRKISQIFQILAMDKVAVSAIFEPKRLRFVWLKPLFVHATIKKTSLNLVFTGKFKKYKTPSFHTFSELTLWNCNWQFSQGFQYSIDSKISNSDFFFCKIHSLNLELEKHMTLQHVKIISLAKIV